MTKGRIRQRMLTREIETKDDLCFALTSNSSISHRLPSYTQKARA